MSRELFSSLVKGCRASLSRAITVVESEKHTEMRREIMRLALKRRNESPTVRMAITGGAGSGKSALIETFGMRLIEKFGRKVAVLAIDPSSAISGGSILGDKTRMVRLSRNSNAFIRPSPNRGHWGGIARATGDAIVLCECAGYDFVLIETVGTGQSEFAVSDYCDVFGYCVAPSGGDEIQALKKGIVEMANLIIVTKSDGELVRHARKMSAEFLSASKYMTAKPFVCRCSALTCDGIDEIYECVRQLTSDSDSVLQNRRVQRVKLLRTHVMNAILDKTRAKMDLEQYERRLMIDDSLSIWDIIDEILEKF